MTATVVGALAVLADEPTQSPYLRDRGGAPVVWRRTRTLLLEDGSTIYGCSECDYTNPNMLSIRPHLQRHSGRSAAASRAADTRRDLGRLSLDEVGAAISRLGALEKELAEWRHRARKAEGALDLLRKALAGG